MNNKTVFITGATDGIGKLTALQLAKQSHRMLIHGRNPQKTLQVTEELKKASHNENIEAFVADLSSLNEVQKLAESILEKHDKIDVLINNAGVGAPDPKYSKDGYELRFAVNYMAPFLLTRHLLPALKKAAPARIVNVSSAGQRNIDFNNLMFEKNFDSTDAYRQSKLALIMFTMDLAEELMQDNVTVNSVHPGTYLDTNMVRNSGIKPQGKPEDGAEAEVFLATSPELQDITGKYFDGKTEAKPLAQAYDKKVREKLEQITLDLIEKINE